MKSQIELHKQIKEVVEAGPENAMPQSLLTLINVNNDTFRFFFSLADERWLKWLWENGFLDAIKKKSKNLKIITYRTPELNYLVRIAEKVPSKVVDVVLEVQISSRALNPEVIDQFLRICSELPADQIARISKKILEDKWVSLMGRFNRHGFEFEKIFKTLANAKDYENLLTIAKAVLSIRSKTEIKNDPGRSITENPFYFSELSYTKVFQHLSNVDDRHIEPALELLISTFAKAIKALGKAPDNKERGAFTIYDNFILADVNFFNLKRIERETISARQDIRELAATIKEVLNQVVKSKQDKPKEIRKIYKSYIETLPDSQAAWRLKLYALSLCRDALKAELKKALFSIFDNPKHPDLMMGAEYYTALQKNFGSLAKTDQDEYIKNAIKLFSDKSGDEKDIEYRKYRGSRVFSVLYKELSGSEHKDIEKAGFEINADFKPSPIVGAVTGGTVAPQGPIPQEEFDKLSITEISKKFQTEWTPEKLDQQNTPRNFLNPLNGEGAGDLMQASIAKRPQDFVNNAELFFDREKLDSHYTYTFFRGIENVVKNNREVASSIGWQRLIETMIDIKTSGEQEPFSKTTQQQRRYSSWLADWDAVHSIMAGLIEELLRESSGKTVIDFSAYRNQLLGVIEYLLNQEDPKPEDEHPKTATRTVTPPGQKPLVSEPFMTAINSVRGKAFEAFVFFVYQDGERSFKKTDKVKISADVKELYKKTLEKEKTKAIRFLFGRYIPTFYYRDKNLIDSLLPKIFSSSDKLLYLAAWEGYISNNLFKELFEDPKFQDLYMKGLALRRDMDPGREFFRDPEEGIAVHIALAHMHYKGFDFENPLFKAFWSKGTEKQNSEFIGFIGRKYLSRDSLDETIKAKNDFRPKLEQLWNWILNNCKHRKSLTEFGYWTRPGTDIFNPTWLADHIKKTLEKTGGELEWDYGLQKVIVELAEVSPEDTLEILEWTLLKYGVRQAEKHRPIFYETEWTEAFEVLYKNPKTKKGTYKLIDRLIAEGGSQFWPLENIVK